MVYGMWIYWTIWSSSVLMLSGHGVFYLDQHVLLVSLCIHLWTRLLSDSFWLPGAITVCINCVLLILLFIKKKKKELLRSLMNTNKTFPMTLTLSGVEKEWVGEEDTTCISCDLSGLEVAHCTVVFVLSLDLCFSGLCLATQIGHVLSP